MVRGLINKPDSKMFALFGFLLLPIFYLCYVGKLGNSLGLFPNTLFAIIAAIFLLQVFEMPLYRTRTKKPDYTSHEALLLGEVYSVPLKEELESGDPRIYNTMVTLNIGGFILPLLFALSVFHITPMLETILITLIMIVATNLLSEPKSGVGITVPSCIGFLTIPFALALSPQSIAPVILVSGVLGILIGMVTRLHSIKERGSAYVNLGGTGSFQAVYITVLLSVLFSFFA
ncbi:MAG: DUF1614 domain-containing protein [Methanocellales archaeon]|nr:DUF1614 domain-containing protein [Methanocellales archaeon]MDD3291318.1 DUF1614 domain-containing protein [Methanocellales archaeon]MDD5235812.1 DUF1614 domain-containing protein [Methanocellales archaeon]MDD5484427.1 DUF1614 domain-containing protein [Methanocellales archaeon]